MPITQTKKQSDIEKRMRILRQSLSVTEIKEKSANIKSHSSSTFSRSEVDTKQISVNKSVSADVAYFKKDLLKITLMSSLAIIAQIALYIAMRNNLINLPI